jgi:DNA-binding transcriptional ArsR family regulator
MDRYLVIAQATACPSRLDLLRLLGERGLTLTEAARQAGLASSTACYHLSVLVNAGLAVRAVRGRKSVYRWSPHRWQLVCTSARTPRASDHGDGNRPPASDK